MMTFFLLRALPAWRLAALALLAATIFGCAQGSPGTLVGPVPMDATVPPEDVAEPDVAVKPDGAIEEGPISTRCATNDDCRASPVGLVCDTATGSCVQCTAGQDMCPPGQFCEPATHACVAGCTSDADCASGGVTRCDPATRRCVGCTADADCALGTVCRTGACVPGCSESHGCGVGQSCCEGQCADLQSSATNCGACGAACPSGGACCAGACQSVTSDAMNCGRCGNVCSVAHGTGVCAAGACAVGTCETGFGDCDRDASNGCEADLSSGSADCGACGRACAATPNATSRCMTGRCVSECSGAFGDCDGNAANGCETAVGDDARNCGACGTACPGGANATARCTSGACSLACVAGFGDCDGSAANGCETNLNASVMSCGACGVLCRFANGNPTCAAGRCALSGCAAGFDNCDGSADNGCETPTAGDSGNCGRCGNRCPAGTACSMGACGSVCMGSTTFCTDRCVTLATDPMNCGACGRACPGGANGVPACRAGSCGVTCNRGFGDCDGSASSGCETSLLTATEHCGACGAACRASNASVACADSTCRVTSCNPGFANCNGSDGDGCEVNTSNNVSNCGGCGRSCNLPNAGASCTGGVCAVSACASGFANCNGVDSDGCEVNTSNSNFNCGRCGMSCAPGTACSGGSCASICGGGTTYCAGSCVSLATDARNCGACGNVCGAGQSCMGGTCRLPAPGNDTCGGAIAISLGPLNQTISVNNTGANTDLPGQCGAAGSDVWYRFTLTQREAVYADTIGTAFDTVLYFASSCSSALTTAVGPGAVLCNDDMACTAGGLQSQVVAVLNPGTYYLVFAGFSGRTGAATIHFQHLPVGNGVINLLNPGTVTYAGATGGSNAVPATCGASATGPENAYWWKTCPETAAGTLSATTCSRASWDTVLHVRNATGAGDACNDDSCFPQSTLTASIGSGAGLHVFYVDGYAGASGSYSVQVTRP